MGRWERERGREREIRRGVSVFIFVTLPKPAAREA
jgi:hypothetical protein